MRIGLIDVDGHNFPNLALMKISAWHKSQGDTVEWWWSDFEHYDIVYMSKVFSDAYSADVAEPMNADAVVKGGTGYAISLVDGKEVYDKSKDPDLPQEVEAMPPDYSIYPQYKFAVAMTSRGCPRGCPFCHVAAKEGKCAHKVADVGNFANGAHIIQCCDPNLLALPHSDKINLLEQYRDTGAYIDYNQGLDIRLMTTETVDILRTTKLKNLHFAWDNPDDNLEDKFKLFADSFGGKATSHGHNGTVFCLTNFGEFTAKEHIDRALHRIYRLRDLGYKPYVMIYDKPHAPRDIKMLQRWCNNPAIFYSTQKFEDYNGKR